MTVVPLSGGSSFRKYSQFNGIHFETHPVFLGIVLAFGPHPSTAAAPISLNSGQDAQIHGRQSLRLAHSWLWSSIDIFPLLTAMGIAKTPNKSRNGAIKRYKYQWLVAPLFSLLLYRYLYFFGYSNTDISESFPVQTSTATSDLVRNTHWLSRTGSPWKSFPGNNRLTPAFPDHASRYDLLSYMQKTGDYDYIEIRGHFPCKLRHCVFKLYGAICSFPNSHLSLAVPPRR